MNNLNNSYISPTLAQIHTLYELVLKDNMPTNKSYLDNAHVIVDKIGWNRFVECINRMDNDGTPKCLCDIAIAMIIA